MLPGQFIGIAHNVGDAFCFLIVTNTDDPDHCQVIACSVVRCRYPQESPLTVDAREYNSLRFYKNDGKTVLDDPVDDSGFSLRDHLQCEESFSHSSPDMAESSAAKDDPLHNAIGEVYGTPTKRQRVEFTDPLAVARGGADPVVSLPRPLPPQPPSGDSPKPNVLTPFPDDLPSPMTPTPPADVSTSTMDLGCDNDPEEPIPTSTLADAAEQPEECSAEVFEDTTHHLEQLAEDAPQDDLFEKVKSHRWDNGILLLEIEWKMGETSSSPFTLVKQDYPYAVAQYILDNSVGTWDGRHMLGRYTRWAHGFLQQVRHTIRCLHRVASGSILRLQDRRPFQLEDSFCGFWTIRHATMTPNTTQPQCKKKQKPGRISHGQPVFKYGVEVPKSTKHAEELDAQHGNSLWKEAYQKEIGSLLSLGCFYFCPPDSKPGPDYQFVKLTMIYEVKQDGRHKAHLVAGSHLVDPHGISTRSTVMKGVSVCLLDVIAHRDNLKVLCGDIGNAFVTAPCLEKVYSRAGPEFGDHHNSIMVLMKALYRLWSSSRAFHGHFADFLHSMGFHSVHYDHDVWMRLHEDRTRYDYICTHMEDFKIVACDPNCWLTQISGVFLLKSTGPPSYYLGNDYVWSTSENAWVLGCSMYIKECIRHLEEDDMIEGRLWEHKNLTEICPSQRVGHFKAPC